MNKFTDTETKRVSYTFFIKDNYFDLSNARSHLPHTVCVGKDFSQEIIVWLGQNCNFGWAPVFPDIRFLDSDDAVLFKLRFG